MTPQQSTASCPAPRWLVFVAQLLVIAGFVSSEAMSYAEDLGVKGGTFLPDPDGRDELKESVRQRQQSGALDHFWQHYRDQVLNAIRHPAPLPIGTDYAARSEFHAVTFELTSDFVDQNGHVVARKGQVIEPLALSPLNSVLVFIDGRDLRQVEWAIRKGQATRAKIILTGGSAIELRERYRDTPWGAGKGVAFYLDQRSMIINGLDKLYGIGLHSVQ
jgi:conjugal transfer pilus assembly protein TraW